MAPAKHPWECAHTTRAHYARGVCKSCYQSRFQRDNQRKAIARYYNTAKGRLNKKRMLEEQRRSRAAARRAVEAAKLVNEGRTSAWATDPLLVGRMAHPDLSAPVVRAPVPLLVAQEELCGSFTVHMEAGIAARPAVPSDESTSAMAMAAAAIASAAKPAGAAAEGAAATDRALHRSASGRDELVAASMLMAYKQNKARGLGRPVPQPMQRVARPQPRLAQNRAMAQKPQAPQQQPQKHTRLPTLRMPPFPKPPTSLTAAAVAVEAAVAAVAATGLDRAAALAAVAAAASAAPRAPVMLPGLPTMLPQQQARAQAQAQAQAQARRPPSFLPLAAPPT